MDFLNDPIVLSILRLTHIFSGMIWLGLGVSGALIVHPVAKSLGEKGDEFMRRYYAYSIVNRVFPAAAILTTLAGLIMWPARVDGMDFAGFGNTGDIVMITGALFGLLAFGHGAAATGRFSDAYGKLAQAIEESDSPSDTQLSELATLRAKVFIHSNISVVLTIIAAVAMSGARYL